MWRSDSLVWFLFIIPFSLWFIGCYFCLFFYFVLFCFSLWPKYCSFLKASSFRLSKTSQCILTPVPELNTHLIQSWSRSPTQKGSWGCWLAGEAKDGAWCLQQSEVPSCCPVPCEVEHPSAQNLGSCSAVWKAEWDQTWGTVSSPSRMEGRPLLSSASDRCQKESRFLCFGRDWGARCSGWRMQLWSPPSSGDHGDIPSSVSCSKVAPSKKQPCSIDIWQRRGRDVRLWEEAGLGSSRNESW